MTEIPKTFPVICIQPDEDSDEHIHGATEGSANRDPYKQQEDEHKSDGCRQLLQGEQQPALSIKHETLKEKEHVTNNHGINEGNHMYAAGDRTTDSFNPSIVKTEPAVDGHLYSKDNIIGGSKHHVKREVEPTQKISWVPRIYCRQSAVKSEAHVDTESITTIWVAQHATQEQQLSIYPMEHGMKSEEGLVTSSYCSLAQNTAYKVEGSLMVGDHIEVKVENTEVKKASVNDSLKIEAIDAAEQLVKASTSEEHVDTNDINYDSVDKRTQNMHNNEQSKHSRKKAAHICQICDKCFIKSSSLTNHMRIHSGERPYKCTVCGMSFARSYTLTTHTRIHSADKPYDCIVCGKSFSRNSTLTTHRRIHTGEKPYECSVCGKAFTQGNNLAIHKRKHIGDKPYECGVCGKRFAYELPAHRVKVL